MSSFIISRLSLRTCVIECSFCFSESRHANVIPGLVYEVPTSKISDKQLFDRYGKLPAKKDLLYSQLKVAHIPLIRFYTPHRYAPPDITLLAISDRLHAKDPASDMWPS